jgi:hypothetical protein
LAIVFAGMNLMPWCHGQYAGIISSGIRHGLSLLSTVPSKSANAPLAFVIDRRGESYLQVTG